MLERSVGEECRRKVFLRIVGSVGVTCCREVLERSVGEERCTEVLANIENV